MPELTSQDYIRIGQYVYLEGVWRKGKGVSLEDTIIKITKADRFDYTKAYILKRGEQGTLDLKDNLKLYPTEYDTLYEIGVGMIGNTKLFIKLPSDKMYYYLEEEGIFSTATPTTEVGGLTEEDIPPIEPKKLREYTVRDMRDRIAYVIVNPSYKDEKAVLKFTVNKLKFEVLKEEEAEKIKENIDEYVSKGLLRILRYPREVR